MTSPPQDSTLIEESSLPVGPARTSPWRDVAKAWAEHVRASSGRSFGSSAVFGLGGSVWRTSLDSCHPSALAPGGGERLRVFCASMADVFEDHPALPETRARLWSLIDATPHLNWLLLTKRPENAAAMVPASWADGWPVSVWCGVSAETQLFAEQRIPILCGLPVRGIRFVSAAPQLGPIDFTRIHAGVQQQPDMVYDVLGRRYGVPGAWQAKMSAGIDWIITEGESGAKARPSHPDWFRSVRDQCASAGVAFHHKQNGELTSFAPDHDRRPTWWVCAETGKAVRSEADVPSVGSWIAMYRVGLKAAGRLLDGELWDEIPGERQAVSA